MRVVYAYVFPAAKYGRGSTSKARRSVAAMGQPVKRVTVHPFTGDVMVRCLESEYLDRRTVQEAETHAGYKVLSACLVER